MVGPPSDESGCPLGNKTSDALCTESTIPLKWLYARCLARRESCRWAIVWPLHMGGVESVTTKSFLL